MGTLWREILEVSSLAASMQDVYEAVSHNRIAALQLDTAEGAVTHSVQIPVPFYLPDLPPTTRAALKACGSPPQTPSSRKIVLTIPPSSTRTLRCFS